jgi:MYXO-CTERM domain-containing protein
MKNVWKSSRQWIAAALVWGAAWVSPARAEYDSFGLGTGRDGTLTVSTTGVVVNKYAQVTAPLVPGDTFVDVQATTGFAAGALVLVHQTTGFLPVPASGSTADISLISSTSSVGRWELARVSAVSGSRLTLTAPLINSYAASVSQVVLVPEYTSVRVESTGTIVASPWNGSVGGIVAFLVQGTLSSDGTISASGAGFRGGAYIRDTTGGRTCTGVDEAAPKGAQRGEGITLDYGATQTGRGNVTTGGGGGVCLKAGGGGGSNLGRGGQGGYSHSSLDGARNVGGMGGAHLSYLPTDRLLFGGGGGAGHGTDGVGGGGGNGGGIIFIRANVMAFNGSVLANGDNAKVSNSGTDAGSGGGAGGAIYLRFVDAASCTAVRARAGRGGSTNAGAAYVGPGGGGGGGTLFYQAKPGGFCPTFVSFGSPGDKQDTSTTPYDVGYGAATGEAGQIYPTPAYNTGYIIPSMPTVRSPSNGALLKTGDVSAETTCSGDKGGVYAFVNGVRKGFLSRTVSGTCSGRVDPTLTFTDGSYTLEFTAFVEDAYSQKTAPITITVDRTPPVAPVVSAPGSGAWLNSRKPTISGTAEANSTVQVVINDSDEGTANATAAGTWSFTLTRTLSDGEYRVKARAVDAAGNVSTDSSVRVFSVDATAPTTKLDEAPSAQTQQTTATFRFSSEDATATFKCNLDGAGFVDCTSPYVTSNLSVAAHTLEIRAQDSLGNVEATPVRYTWTITNGTPDAGSNPGTPDAGSNPGTPDAGSNPGPGGGEPEKPTGCGCSSPVGEPSVAMMALAGLAALVSRRRRQ